MTVFVDHEQRRKKILDCALVLFAAEGYAGVTYQKIADACGISRTSIYKYFSDKDQIFDYAIKSGTDNISSLVQKVVDRADWSATEKIRRVLHLTSKVLSENSLFLTVVLEYLLSQRQAGTNVRRKVRRHTCGMKVFLNRLLQEALAKNEIRPCDPEIVAGQLYCILESFVLNLTAIDVLDWKECVRLINVYLNELQI